MEIFSQDRKTSPFCTLDICHYSSQSLKVFCCFDIVKKSHNERSKHRNFGAAEGWLICDAFACQQGQAARAPTHHGDFLWEGASFTANFMFLKPIVSKSHQGNDFTQNLLQAFRPYRLT